MSVVLNYRFDRLTVRVETTAPDYHIWLEEFLRPHFDVIGGDNFDVRVTLIEDTAGFESMLRGETPEEEIDCFVMDSQIIRLPGRYSSTGAILVFDEKYRVFYLINRQNKEISLITPAGNFQARVSLMRVIRELAMNASINAGGLFVHGAAFTVDGRGVILAGSKGAGKTTLLLHTLINGNTNYLSGDRVLVSFEERGVIFRGMPTIAAILPSTLDRFPDFRDRLLASGFHYSLTIAEAIASGCVPRQGKSGKYGLTPAQFCHLLGLKSIGSVSGSALVFPRITGTTGGINLRRLSGIESLAHLSPALFGGYYRQTRSSIFDISPTIETNIDRSFLNHLCREFISRIPCYECYLGTEAYDKDGGINDFLDILARRTAA